MDIFTTALTKIVPATIKPSSLKVKALLKEPNTNALSDDANHLEYHDYFYLVKEGGKNKSEGKTQNKPTHEEEAECEPGIKASEDVIIHKDDIIHPKNHDNDPDDDITHLDIFV